LSRERVGSEIKRRDESTAAESSEDPVDRRSDLRSASLGIEQRETHVGRLDRLSVIVARIVFQ
jgi:hypothetical protein